MKPLKPKRWAAVSLHALSLSLGIASAALIDAPPAYAIDCERDYQRVQGNLIATPYCQDEYLARVARDSGIKASADRIRNNPNYKRDVCRFVGHDIRAQSACVNEEHRGRPGRF